MSVFHEDNPLRAARLALGLTRRELAQAMGLPYERIAAVELGYPGRIPQSWLPKLQSAGIEAPSELIRAYGVWRNAIAAPLVRED